MNHINPRNINVVNRNQNGDNVIHQIRQNVGGIIPKCCIKSLKHGFNVGYANRPYFVYVFPNVKLQFELPRGIKFQI